jgi:hypothetical protein
MQVTPAKNQSQIYFYEKCGVNQGCVLLAKKAPGF